MVISPLIEVEPLRTILNLECQKNYTDTAVIGGLDKYLVNWSRQNKRKIASPKYLARFKALGLSEPGYATLDREKRKSWVNDFLDWLAEVEKTTAVIPKENKKISSKVSSRISGPSVNSRFSGVGLDASVTALSGIKVNLAAKLGKLGVQTIRDLLYFFPRRHLDYSQRKCIAELEMGEEQTILGSVWEARVVRLGGQQGTEVTLGDETGNVRAVWFNQPYLAKRFPTNAQIVISGKLDEYKGRPVFQSPEWELLEDKELTHTGRLVPVYPLTSGLYPRQVRNLVKKAIDEWAGRLEDFLPQETKKRSQLLGLPEAIIQAHYPDDLSMKNAARKRLAFDELFLIQLGVLSKKRNWQEGQPGNAFVINMEKVNRFLSSLPFKLTHDQEKVLHEILSDLKQSKPMSRLLQGDVGSGKTVVAMAALFASVDNSYQGALMAPTEILAEQHYYNICRLLSKISNNRGDPQENICCYQGLFPRPITFSLLTGKMSEREKVAIHQKISDGEIDIIIGTHALIQKGVEFSKLGLVVIDEQHRFGVLQRSALRQKGFNPHVLVMTATPIPRTLALTLYGDLDLSVIDELPPGRQVIKTSWLRDESRGKAYEFIRGQVATGHQAFIICPLIEESDNIEAKAAVAEYKRLSCEIFPDLRLGLLHGRMSNDEKDEIMHSFRAGALDILVSTSVVEVGIDVPNATVMLIEAADRFGLSQLHQFRGRVGRGESQSYCLLLSENPSMEGQARLEAIERIHDGFALAEKDLELRGPGEFFGTRQSGLPDLRMAKLSDVRILELARNEAVSIFQVDPDLKLPAHRLLASELIRVWPNSSEWS